MGFLLLGLSLLEFAPFFLIKFYDQLIILINTLVQWIAQQEIFIFRNIPFDGFQAFLTYAALLLLIALIEYRKSKIIWILGGTILISQSWTLRQKVQKKNRSELILYHQIAQTLLVEENGGYANAYLRNEKDAYSASIVQTAAVQNRIKDIAIKPLKNSYMWQGKHILVIDNSGIHSGVQEGVDFIILTDNPRINLDRVLTAYPTARIVADGSNYTYLTDAWRTSCLKAKRPFHYTGEKGAFYFNESQF
jgi:competence protein ComEC